MGRKNIKSPGWPRKVKDQETKHQEIEREQYRKALRMARDLYHHLLWKCPHHIEKVHDIAKCTICNNHYGWWCPKSPDHQCHYFSEFDKHGKRYVELAQVRGEERIRDYNLPERQGKESDDWCIYCEHPEERK